MTADPYELRNLAPLPEYESHVAELDKILLSEVDYPEVAKTLLAENRANVARWMAGVGDRWEALMRNAHTSISTMTIFRSSRHGWRTARRKRAR